MTQANVIAKQFGEKEHEEAVAAGRSLPPRNVVQHAPSNLSIVHSIRLMGDLEHDNAKKLQEIAYYTALKGQQPFPNFKEHLEIEQMHGIEYSEAYLNENACKNIFFGITKYFFEEKIKNKLVLANFLAVLYDGSTDKSITEQEVVYIIFTDPETHLLVLKFFHIIVPSINQDTPGLKQAITDSFKENSLESALEKIVFLSSDRASVQCGKNSGFIKSFQEDYPWILFI